MKQEHKDILLYVMSLVVLVVFLQTCGVKSSIREMGDDVVYQIAVSDSTRQSMFAKTQSCWVCRDAMAKDGYALAEYEAEDRTLSRRGRTQDELVRHKTVKDSISSIKQRFSIKMTSCDRACR